MTKQEDVNRNIGLTFDFAWQLIDEPSMLENIPDGVEIDFVEKDFVRFENKQNTDEGKFLIKVTNEFELIN